MQVEQGRRSGEAAWAGFLAAAFCVVGMMGLVASYAAPLPFARALHREAVLDRLLVVAPSGRAALRDELGDSADAVLAGTGTLEARVAAERPRMRVRFEAEAETTLERLRLLIVLVTITGALFGAAMLGLQRRG